MKKTILFILSLSLCFNCLAQHLSILNIPIDGSITNFEKKLKAKGFKFDKNELDYYADGIRFYNGIYQGNKSRLKVFFNRKTKIVYKIDLIIHSNDAGFIDRLEKKTTTSLKSKYVLKDHTFNINDLTGTQTHKYSVCLRNPSSEIIGFITICKTATFDVTNNLKHSGFSLIYTFEDAKNTSLLTPSTKEPNAPYYLPLVFENPDIFYKDIFVAEECFEQGCYEGSIDHYLSALDFFKYDSAPVEASDYEDIIEKNIIELEKFEIGIIKTAYADEYTKAYYIIDDRGKFKYVQYGANFAFGYTALNIRLTSQDIKQQITELERLKIAFSKKLKEIEKVELKDYWREKIDITIPALFGNVITFEPLKIDWKHCDLTCEFGHYKPDLYNLYVMINEGSNSILRFNSIEDIDTYMNFLKSINTN